MGVVFLGAHAAIMAVNARVRMILIERIIFSFRISNQKTFSVVVGLFVQVSVKSGALWISVGSVHFNQIKDRIGPEILWNTGQFSSSIRLLKLIFSSPIAQPYYSIVICIICGESLLRVISRRSRSLTFANGLCYLRVGGRGHCLRTRKTRSVENAQ